MLRQLSRSLVSPAEHVSKHIEGGRIRLTRACAGNGGTRAGSTGGAGGSCAQAVSSTASIGKLAFKVVDLGLSGIGHLLHVSRALCFDLALAGLGVGPGALGYGLTAGKLGACIVAAPPLPPTPQQRGGQGGGEPEAQVQPVHGTPGNCRTCRW